MTNGGRNRDSGHHTKSQSTREHNERDEAVTRDPDIRGVLKGARDGRKRDGKQ